MLFLVFVICGGAKGTAGRHRGVPRMTGGSWPFMTGGSELRKIYRGSRGGGSPGPRFVGVGSCWRAKKRVCLERWLRLTRAPPRLPAHGDISICLVKGMTIGQ